MYNNTIIYVETNIQSHVQYRQSSSSQPSMAYCTYLVFPCSFSHILYNLHYEYVSLHSIVSIWLVTQS